MIVWHPEVHYLFGESLYYFIIAVRPFNDDVFQKEINAFLEKEGFEGCCRYDVYGVFDVLIRIWLPSGHEKAFQDKVLANIKNVRQILPFHVADIAKNWNLEENLQGWDGSMLKSLTVKKIKDVQKLEDKSKYYSELRQGRLLAKIAEQKKIKVFIALNQPSGMDLEGLEEIEKKVVDLLVEYSNKKIVSRPSLYIGWGFAWALVKMEVDVKNYFQIAPFVLRLSTTISPFGAYPTTYLCIDSSPIERDAISQEAFTDAEGRDLEVANFVPDVYRNGVLKGTKQAIETWVRQNDPGAFDKEEQDTVQRCLRGVISQDDDIFYESLQNYFRKLETFLRERTGAFVGHRTDNKPQKIYAEARIEKGKLLALGDFLRLISTTIEAHPQNEAEQELVGKWEGLAELRNKIAHGACQPKQDWKAYLSTLVDSFVRVKKLKEVLLAELCDEKRV